MREFPSGSARGGHLSRRVPATSSTRAGIGRITCVHWIKIRGTCLFTQTFDSLLLLLLLLHNHVPWLGTVGAKYNLAPCCTVKQPNTLTQCEVSPLGDIVCTCFFGGLPWGDQPTAYDREEVFLSVVCRRLIPAALFSLRSISCIVYDRYMPEKQQLSASNNVHNSCSLLCDSVVWDFVSPTYMCLACSFHISHFTVHAKKSFIVCYRWYQESLYFTNL